MAKTKTVTKKTSVIDELVRPDKGTLLLAKYTDRGFLNWGTEYPSLDSYKAYVGEIKTNCDYVHAEFTINDGYHGATVSFDLYENEEEDAVLDRVLDFKNAVDNFAVAVEKAVEARRMARKVKGE